MKWEGILAELAVDLKKIVRENGGESHDDTRLSRGGHGRGSG
jgi:hypothetical protein